MVNVSPFLEGLGQPFPPFLRPISTVGLFLHDDGDTAQIMNIVKSVIKNFIFSIKLIERVGKKS